MISRHLVRTSLLGLTLVAASSLAQEPSAPPPPPLQTVEPAPAAAPAAPAAPQRYVSPRELEKGGQLVPYEGGQIPPGARLISKPRSGLLTAGLVIGAVSYLPWLAVDIIATIASAQLIGGGLAFIGGLILAIPVLGPALTGAISLGQTSSGPAVGVIFLGDAVLQALAIGLIAYAYGSPEQFVVQPTAPPPPRTSWMILPGIQGVNGPATGARLALVF
jgi:hypothetical protein